MIILSSLMMFPGVRNRNSSLDDRFLVSETDDNLYDLCLMTMCKGYIIANSSFSWWGAWLSETENP